MKTRRVGPSTLSLFAGVSLVSSGLISMFIAGTHPTQYAQTTAATNICGQHPLTALVRPGAATARQAQLQLDSASVRQVISPTSPAVRPTAPASNPGGPISSATPTTTSPTSPATSPATPPATTPAPTPTTPKPTPTTPKPTPSKTTTPPPPPVQLCLSVQATASTVQPGGTAIYAIWVWPSGGTANGITVTASAKISGALTPRFSVCRAASGATCSVGSLANGQADELLANVTSPTTAKAGQHVALTATAKATGAKSAAPASASTLIAAKAGSTPTNTSPTLPGSALPSGVGATLPGGLLIPVGVAASAALPVLPTATSDPGGLFPTVGPGATPSASTGTLPNARGVRVTDASASFPLSTRLLGGQVLGLAVLAAALVIAIARLSLREPHRQHGKDPAP
jgi:hypothetical protein